MMSPSIVEICDTVHIWACGVEKEADLGKGWDQYLVGNGAVDFNVEPEWS
jgi:hypothetical protein